MSMASARWSLRCIQQIAIIKVAFFPGTDMAKAMASVVSEVNRAQARMPPNVLPPLVIQMDAGSVPVGYLVLESDTRPLGELGASRGHAGPAAGAKVRARHHCHSGLRHQRALDLSERRSRSHAPDNLSPDDIVQAIKSGNLVAPSGNLYMKDEMPLAATNAMIANVHASAIFRSSLGAICT